MLFQCVSLALAYLYPYCSQKGTDLTSMLRRGKKGEKTMTAHLLSVKKTQHYLRAERENNGFSGAELSFALVAGWLLSLLWDCAWLKQCARLPEPSGCQDDREHRARGGGEVKRFVYSAPCCHPNTLSPQCCSAEEAQRAGPMPKTTQKQDTMHPARTN